MQGRVPALPKRTMQQPPSERLAIAAHLHVAMRRKLGRVTDTEWLAQNRGYAQAMITLCEQQADADLLHWAQRLAALWAEAKPSRAPVRASLATVVQDALAQRYIGRLR